MARPKYGPAHQRAVKYGLRALPIPAPCVRCHHDMDKRIDVLNLDHDDNGDGYLGFSHSSPCRDCGRRCNQLAGGIKAAQQAGKRLRERRCVICGTPFTAARGRTSAVQETCGKRECISQLKASRKAHHEDPEPPGTGGRVW